MWVVRDKETWEPVYGSMYIVVEGRLVPAYPKPWTVMVQGEPRPDAAEE